MTVHNFERRDASYRVEYETLGEMRVRVGTF